MKAYLNREDTRMRLDNTVCLWKGEPVYVSVQGNGGETGHLVKISFFDGSGRRSRSVNYTSDNFTYAPIRLGYLWGRDGTAPYLTRIPARRQKQGLCGQSISIYPKNMMINFQWWLSPEIYACIVGTYPNEVEIIEALKNGVRGVPLHREVAFQKIDKGLYSLNFAEEMIGTYETKTDKLNLLEKPSTSVFGRIMEARGLGYWLGK